MPTTKQHKTAPKPSYKPVSKQELLEWANFLYRQYEKHKHDLNKQK